MDQESFSQEENVGNDGEIKPSMSRTKLGQSKRQQSTLTSASSLFGTGDTDNRAKNVFSFTNCEFAVKQKKSMKRILKGFSGAGKTTLLHLMTLHQMGGYPSGDITLNGETLNTQMFRQRCSFVAQEDHLWTFLTCRECLLYAADMALAISKAERVALVDGLIMRMGLQSCSNTRCGNIFISGLSGGQKRRLSIAIALIKNPTVLFLDEPTSGLDSASAAGIMAFLTEIAKELNVIVVCTIHQPSTAVFGNFDGIMVLSDGRVAYSGKASQAIGYFASIGKVMPDHHNPAEFMLDLVNKDFTDQAQVDAILDKWQEQEIPILVETKVLHPPKLERTGFLKQTVVQFKRQFWLSFRDPLLYLTRVAIFMVACIFFSLVYIEARTHEQVQATRRMFLIMWFLAVPCCMGVIAVFALNMEFLSIKREIKDGLYNPWAYLISNAFLQIPWVVMLAIAALGISAYGVSNFHAPMYGEVLLTMSLTLWAFEMFAQTYSVLVRNPLIGILIFIMTWFSAFLFSGFFVKEEDVVWPLKVFVFCLPFRWALSSMVKSEFKHTEWTGATLIAQEPGFMCDGPPDADCYGKTGEQVLESLSANYTLFKNPDTLMKDVLFLLAIGCVMKAVFCILFILGTRDGKQPAAGKVSGKVVKLEQPLPQPLNDHVNGAATTNGNGQASSGATTNGSGPMSAGPGLGLATRVPDSVAEVVPFYPTLDTVLPSRGSNDGQPRAVRDS